MIFCFQTINACSLVIPPLRKEFRKSKAVFIGKVLKVEETYSPTAKAEKNIPFFWREMALKYRFIYSKVTFEIKNKWKDNLPKTVDFVTIAAFDCNCPGGGIDFFEIGEEFLVMASGKRFAFICDSKKTSTEWAKSDIKRLNSFWFRAWTNLYPF